MYSYFTFLELVKVISVHRAHRLLSESTLILCTWRNRLSVTVSGFDRLLSDNTTNIQAKQHAPRLINDRYRDCLFHLLLSNGCGFCRPMCWITVETVGIITYYTAHMPDHPDWDQQHREDRRDAHALRADFIYRQQ